MEWYKTIGLLLQYCNNSPVSRYKRYNIGVNMIRGLGFGYESDRYEVFADDGYKAGADFGDRQ